MGQGCRLRIRLGVLTVHPTPCSHRYSYNSGMCTTVKALGEEAQVDQSKLGY